MKNEHIQQTAKLLSYINDISVKETSAQQSLREKTAHLELAIMQISPIQGQFIKFLLTLINAKKCLEIGTFCGYSSLVIAETIGPDASLITCDVNETWTNYAKQAWTDANVVNKVTLKLAEANQTLDDLINTEQDSFDFIFIDADKTNYEAYYEKSLTLLKPGGLMLIDNIFWDGRVLEEHTDDKQTLAIQNLNKKIQTDNRVSSCIVTIADGLFLVQKQ